MWSTSSAKKGKFTLLHSFTGGTNDGCQIYGIPAMDKQGNIYGTAEACGANSYGLVWKVTPQGAETILHAFEATRRGFPLRGSGPGRQGRPLWQHLWLPLAATVRCSK